MAGRTTHTRGRPLARTPWHFGVRMMPSTQQQQRPSRVLRRRRPGNTTAAIPRRGPNGCPATSKTVRRRPSATSDRRRSGEALTSSPGRRCRQRSGEVIHSQSHLGARLARRRRCTCAVLGTNEVRHLVDHGYCGWSAMAVDLCDWGFGLIRRTRQASDG
jgi:hypothetical protein